jgi:hypothetical protein
MITLVPVNPPRRQLLAADSTHLKAEGRGREKFTSPIPPARFFIMASPSTSVLDAPIGREPSPESEFDIESDSDTKSDSGSGGTRSPTTKAINN